MGHSCQYLLFVVFLIIAILTGARWYLVIILIYISLISGVEHLFMYLWTIGTSSLGNCLFKILCPFFKVEIAFVYNILCFMCITLWFYICIHYSRSHQKFSFHSSPYSGSSLAISPIPSANHYCLLYLHVCFCLACSFICFTFVFYIPCMSEIIQNLSFSILVYLA